MIRRFFDAATPLSQQLRPLDGEESSRGIREAVWRSSSRGGMAVVRFEPTTLQAAQAMIAEPEGLIPLDRAF